MSSNDHAPILFAQYQTQKLKTWFNKFNKPGTTILDFGCGTGLMTNFVQEVFYEAKITGVDPDADNIKKAQEAYPTLDSRLLANDTLPFADNSFDFIYSANVLHHIPFQQHSAVIKEIIRVLKPGGTLAILELNPYNPWTAYTFSTNPIEKDAHMLKPGYVRSLLKPFGLPKTWYYNFFPNILSWLIPLENGISWLPIGSLYGVIITKER